MSKTTLLLIVISPLFSGIEVSTVSLDADLDNACQRGSFFKINIRGNQFGDASVDKPYYIRLQLNQGVRLCKTLVWMNKNNPTHTRKPIFLSMIYPFGEGLVTDLLIADSTSIALVRWVSGEDSIWLRVNQNSFFWVDSAGGGGGPTDMSNREVYVILEILLLKVAE